MMPTPSAAMRREQRLLVLHVLHALDNDARLAIIRSKQGAQDADKRMDRHDYTSVRDFLSRKDARWVESVIDMYAPLVDLTMVDAELMPLEQQLDRVRFIPRPLKESMLGRIRTARNALLGKSL